MPDDTAASNATHKFEVLLKSTRRGNWERSGSNAGPPTGVCLNALINVAG